MKPSLPVNYCKEHGSYCGFECPLCVAWKELQSDIKFSLEELHLIRVWFDAVQDIAHKDYLEPKDFVLAKRIYEKLNMRVPHGILERIT